jgi:hypothetical protein
MRSLSPYQLDIHRPQPFTSSSTLDLYKNGFRLLGPSDMNRSADPTHYAEEKQIPKLSAAQGWTMHKAG